jgi:hypothetical protein
MIAMKKIFVFTIVFAMLLLVGGACAATPYSKTLPLNEGWNTVSTPYHTNATPESLNERGIKTSMIYDGTSWIIYNPSNYLGEAIPATTAFYIYVDDPSGGSITFQSTTPYPSVIDPDDICERSPVAPGWNFIGVSPRISQDGSSWISEQMLVKNAFPSAAMVISPASNDGFSWDTTNTDTQLEVFKGYWVYMNGDYVNVYWV